MKKEVLIIGGGIAGPALAIFLNRAGIASRIFEAYPQADDIGGGMQIAPNGMHVLREIGIAEEILADGVASDEFCLENQQGKTLGVVSNGPASKYGVPAVQIARSALHRALLGEVTRRGIPIAYRKRLRRIRRQSSGVVAEFGDGALAEGSLLIGADGIHSRTRELIFPDGPRPAYTGLFTIGGFATHSSLTPSSERAIGRAHLIFGLDGFFGYAYCDKRRPDTLMWWSHLQRDAEPNGDEYKSWPADELRKELLAHHRGWPAPVETIIRNASELLRGPVYDVPSLPAWSEDRVLLIGDAAHAISPHAGQGASLALEDAITLAKLLRDAPSSHQQAFERFARERRDRVARIVAEARRRGDGKRTLTPAAAWIRDRLIAVWTRARGETMNDWMYSYKVAWER